MIKQRSTTEGTAEVGVLSFEVAGLMSKTVQIWHSLADDRVARMRDTTIRLAGVRKLVSNNDAFLLALARAEITTSLLSLARSAARLGARRCSSPVLQRLAPAFANFAATGVDPYGLAYAGRKIERKIRKMNRLVAASAGLYREQEVLAELEQELAKTKPGQQRRLADRRCRDAAQRQVVKRLQEASLWVRSYDYTVRLLARSLFTVLARVKIVFAGDSGVTTLLPAGDSGVTTLLPRSKSVIMRSPVHPADANELLGISTGPLLAHGKRSLPTIGHCTPRWTTSGSMSKWPASHRPFSQCMTGGNGIGSPVLQRCISRDHGLQKPNAVSRIANGSEDGSKLLNAPISTLGAAALALHYANVIVVIEKLVVCPHLIGQDARDDLYDMLPASIRATLRVRLKSCGKTLVPYVHDPTVAAEWSETVTRILEWLAPLAHNMIKWQSDRNFEQKCLVSRTNILLLQTLYFADQIKTEAAITELLVGLNYLYRFKTELNAKADICFQV